MFRDANSHRNLLFLQSVEPKATDHHHNNMLVLTREAVGTGAARRYSRGDCALLFRHRCRVATMRNNLLSPSYSSTKSTLHAVRGNGQRLSRQITEVPIHDLLDVYV